jgi:hypothetical protein
MVLIGDVEVKYVEEDMNEGETGAMLLLPMPGKVNPLVT